MHKRTIIIVLAVSAIFAALLAGCSGTQAERDGDNTGSGTNGVTVVARDLTFRPTSVEVSPGEVVTFTNEDSEPHEVQIDGERLGVQQPGDSVTWTAEKTGDFEYFCTIHPSMTGMVTVK